MQQNDFFPPGHLPLKVPIVEFDFDLCVEGQANNSLMSKT